MKKINLNFKLIFLSIFCRFFEIFVNTPLNVCEKRDVKGLYKKARDGLISGFTGVSQEYQPPKNPDLTVATENMSIQESTHRLIDFLEDQNIIPRNLREVEKVKKKFVVDFWFSLVKYSLMVVCKSKQSNFFL